MMNIHERLHYKVMFCVVNGGVTGYKRKKQASNQAGNLIMAKTD